MFQKVRKKRRREGKDLRAMQSPKDAKGSLGVTVNDGKNMERCPVPFHVWSIPRPQDKFDVVVDNSNTPFKHPKQLRRLPVEKAAAFAEDIESNDSAHPLEEELRSMDFADLLMPGTIDPKKPKGLSETPFTYVDTPAALKDVAAKLLLEQEIAVDLEHHQFRSFQGLTCLMQISTRSEDFIIDTLELRSLIGPELLGIFSNPTIQKVMHGADWDILWLQRDFGIYVCNLFDTGQASRVLGMKSYSLLHLLEHFCGVVSDKRYQMADWRLRPLPTEMLRYAREDTHYLLYVGDLLKEMLVSAQFGGLEGQDSLLEVFKRSRDICLKLYEKEITIDTSYLQVYGLWEKQFQAEQLAVLDGLYSWRDQVARTEDESTGYVLPNHLLLKLAEEMPDNVKKLRCMLSGRHPLITQNIATIVAIICKSRLNASMYTNQANELKVEAEKAKYARDVPSALDQKVSDTGIGETTNGGEQINPLSCRVERASTGDSLFDVEWIPEQDKTDDISTDSIPTIVTNKSKDRILQQTPLDIIANEPDFGGSIKAGTGATTSCVVVKRSSTSSLFGNRKEKNAITNKLLSTSTHNHVSGVVDEIKRDAESIACSDDSRCSMLTDEKVAEKSDCKCTSTVMRGGKSPFGGMASMFGRASYMHQNVKGNMITCEDHEQAEARLKAEKIRASLALPFHSFDGVNQSHQTVTLLEEKCRNLEAVNKYGEEHGTHELPQKVIADEYMSLHSMDTEGVQPEGVMHLSGKDKENESGKDPNLVGLLQEGIGISERGTKHRQWWPDVTCSAQQLSSDFTLDETSEIGEVKRMASELPLSISEKYRKSHQCREGWGSSALVSSSTMSNVSAELSGYCTLGMSNAHALKHDVMKKKHATFGGGEELNSEQKSIDTKPFDYGAARKTMGCFGGWTDSNDGIEGPALWKSRRSKQIRSGSEETSFDPLRKVKEFKPEGINPGKRRQVFPHTGNRTGVFK